MPSPSLTLLRTQSDDRLVALARVGHERAFEAIVERYRRPLLRAARRVLPEARAEDALQQALIAAWTALQRGDDGRDLGGGPRGSIEIAAVHLVVGTCFEPTREQQRIAHRTGEGFGFDGCRRARRRSRGPETSEQGGDARLDALVGAG